MDRMIAVHQPNFMPWFPYFEKMDQCDTFVILTETQFEKNSFTNRCKVNGKWWSNPVSHGMKPIIDKRYTDGTSLLEVNTHLIVSIARMLRIDVTKIKFDFPTDNTGTERIIEICQHYEATQYLTNPDATKKYLDAKAFDEAGIEIVPFISENKKHVFELFSTIGVAKTKELLINERKSREKNAEGSAGSSPDGSEGKDERVSAGAAKE